MRRIFDKPKIGELQQGDIINCCIAEAYHGCNVFGIVITPRCDLVESVHYLPVVAIDDWVYRDFWIVFSKALAAKILGDLRNILAECKLSVSVLETISYPILASNFKNKMKQMQYSKFCTLLDHHQALEMQGSIISDSQKHQIISLYKKDVKNLIKEIRENRRKEFYILESWNGDGNHYIVLLREVRRIKFEVAFRIKDGFFECNMPEEEYKQSDLLRTNDPLNLVCSQSTLRSPFIEHLLQCFFANFGRIGVDDYPIKLEEEYVEQLISKGA